MSWQEVVAKLKPKRAQNRGTMVFFMIAKLGSKMNGFAGVFPSALPKLRTSESTKFGRGWWK